ALNPGVQTSPERAREEIGQREQSSLRAIEYVQVLDRLVHLTVFRVAQVIPVVAFQQHAHERVQKMQLLRRRVEREGIDRHVTLTQSDFHIAALQDGGELPVAVSEIENDRQRVVLLRVR